MRNRSLRMCYYINNPIDIRFVDLHENAKIDTLCL